MTPRAVRGNTVRSRASGRREHAPLTRYALETDIARLATDYLEFQGWLVIRTEANAVRRGTRGAGGIVTDGEPDARAFKRNLALHLEFKRGCNGKLRPNQKLRHAYLATFGIRVHVIASLEDLVAALKLEGAL